MNDFCDLLGTPYAPVSKIAPVKSKSILYVKSLKQEGDTQKRWWQKKRNTIAIFFLNSWAKFSPQHELTQGLDESA